MPGRSANRNAASIWNRINVSDSAREDGIPNGRGQARGRSCRSCDTRQVNCDITNHQRRSIGAVDELIRDTPVHCVFNRDLLTKNRCGWCRHEIQSRWPPRSDRDRQAGGERKGRSEVIRICCNTWLPIDVGTCKLAKNQLRDVVRIQTMSNAIVCLQCPIVRARSSITVIHTDFRHQNRKLREGVRTVGLKPIRCKVRDSRNQDSACSRQTLDSFDDKKPESQWSCFDSQADAVNRFDDLLSNQVTCKCRRCSIRNPNRTCSDAVVVVEFQYEWSPRSSGQIDLRAVRNLVTTECIDTSGLLVH